LIAPRVGVKPLLLAGMAVLLSSAMGCEHHFFRTEGAIASDGGPLGSWESAPLGCIRSPAAGPRAGRSATIATFLWDDKFGRDVFYQTHSPGATNFPARLEIAQTASGLTGILETQKPVTSTPLNATVCGTLRMTTHDGKPVIKGGKPTLEGTLTLDCRVEGSHLSGELRFSGCEL